MTAIFKNVSTKNRIMKEFSKSDVVINLIFISKYFACESVQKKPAKVFCEKGVFKNFANFTGKRMCWSPFLIKL